MYKIFLYCLISLSGHFAIAQTAQADTAAVFKKISIEPRFRDLGKIPHGIAVEYKVTLTNHSKDTITLEDVKAGCGCTTPKYRAGEKIGPGSSTYIIVGFNGDAQGTFSKTMDIYFKQLGAVQIGFHGNAFSDSSNQKTPVIINRK
jgi:hypothetical protein